MTKLLLTSAAVAMLSIPAVLSAQEKMEGKMMDTSKSEDCMPADKMKEGMTDDAMMEEDSMMEEDAMAEDDSMTDSMEEDAMKKDCMAADDMEMKEDSMMEDKMDH